jgi:hypothetical protein
MRSEFAQEAHCKVFRVMARRLVRSHWRKKVDKNGFDRYISRETFKTFSMYYFKP